MCAACVAQGVVYVGGAVAGLQVMSARAKAKRRARHEVEGETAEGFPGPAPETPAPARGGPGAPGGQATQVVS